MADSRATLTKMADLIEVAGILNPFDLESFYHWTQDAYEALRHSPLEQRRFDECCRSSYDSTTMRLYLGVWLLKLSMKELESLNRVVFRAS